MWQRAYLKDIEPVFRDFRKIIITILPSPLMEMIKMLFLLDPYD